MIAFGIKYTSQKVLITVKELYRKNYNVEAGIEKKKSNIFSSRNYVTIHHELGRVQ